MGLRKVENPEGKLKHKKFHLLFEGVGWLSMGARKLGMVGQGGERCRDMRSFISFYLVYKCIEYLLF